MWIILPKDPYKIDCMQFNLPHYYGKWFLLSFQFFRQNVQNIYI